VRDGRRWLVSLAVVAVLPVAFAGGLVSGRAEQPATPRPRRAITAAVTVPVPPDAQAIAAIEAQLQQDMTFDVQSQVLDPDPLTRGVLAETPDAINTRRALIALAWVPVRAAQFDTAYDRILQQWAGNPAQPSVTGARFVVTAWSTVTVSNAVVRAVFDGHYELTEPRGPGLVDQPDRLWTVVAEFSGGRWRMRDRA
jgi:hypothetical protein